MTVVREFHLRYGHPVADYPSLPSDEVLKFRERLITEEYKEVKGALAELRLAETPDAVIAALQHLLKELADLRYVTEGLAVVAGLPIDEAYEEVHRSNMSKDPNGQEKPTKGAAYFEADMARFVPAIITIPEEDIEDA